MDDPSEFCIKCGICNKKFKVTMRNDEWNCDAEQDLRLRVWQHSEGSCAASWEDIVDVPVEQWGSRANAPSVIPSKLYDPPPEFLVDLTSATPTPIATPGPTVPNHEVVIDGLIRDVNLLISVLQDLLERVPTLRQSLAGSRSRSRSPIGRQLSFRRR